MPEPTLKAFAPDRRLIWAVLAFANAIGLYLQWRSGAWLFHKDWSIYAHDYIAQWAAGLRVLHGQSALVYDWSNHVAFQTKLLGSPKPVDFYIFYPPHFLFTTPAFALLRPVPAYLAFLASTAALYTAALNLVVRDWLRSIAAALAGGGAYFCILWVQNGFLMGALLLASLVMIPHRPRLAGALLGVLTIKPQLGLLIPIALAAGGHWRTIGWATATFLVLAASAEFFLGPGIWAAFFRSMSQTIGFLEAGSLWFKMQSPFALALPLVGQSWAYAIQALISLIAGGLTIKLWLDKSVSHFLKCAALVAGTLLMSPYLYPYDAVVLTGAALLLVRENPDLPWPDALALIVVCVLPGFARIIFSAAVPMAAFGMLVLVLRQSERTSKEPTYKDPAAPQVLGS